MGAGSVALIVLFITLGIGGVVGAVCGIVYGCKGLCKKTDGNTIAAYARKRRSSKISNEEDKRIGSKTLVEDNDHVNVDMGHGKSSSSLTSSSSSDTDSVSSSHSNSGNVKICDGSSSVISLSSGGSFIE